MFELLLHRHFGVQDGHINDQSRQADDGRRAGMNFVMKQDPLRVIDRQILMLRIVHKGPQQGQKAKIKKVSMPIDSFVCNDIFTEVYVISSEQ